MIDFRQYKKFEFPEDAIVACQGVEGSYSQIAAKSLFGNPEIMYMRTFDGVFRAVDQGLCRYGILPVENSIGGSVTAVYDLMKAYNFYIVRGVKVTISHVLLAKEKVGLDKVSEIYTHEQAAAQCGRFLDENSRINLNICGNTAAASLFVSESERTDIAAISSENCEELYNLSVIAKNIQNNENNYTRFICISKDCEIFDDSDKISLMLSLEHKAGTLHEVIKQFADLNLNLTKLESRPIEGTDFEFMFYFDLQANINDKGVGELINNIKHVKEFMFLGNYKEIV